MRPRDPSAFLRPVGMFLIANVEDGSRGECLDPPEWDPETRGSL